MTVYIDSKYKYVHENIINDEINIHLEIYNIKQFELLKNHFFKTIKSSFNETIFYGKKEIDRTINDIFIRWWMVQYSTNNQTNALIPNVLDSFYLKETLIDFIQKDKTYNEGHIDTFITDLNLDEISKLLLIKIDKFKSSKLVDNIKSRYSFSASIVNKFMEITLVLPYSVKFINNLTIKIPLKIYDKLIKLKDDISLIYILVQRYKIIDSWNNQLAINPCSFEILRKKLNINFECFGSGMNTICDN